MLFDRELKLKTLLGFICKLVNIVGGSINPHIDTCINVLLTTVILLVCTYDHSHALQTHQLPEPTMPDSTLVYSRLQLLQEGKRFLSLPAQCHRISTSTFNTINDLGICCTARTIRGKKGGLRVKAKSGPKATLALMNARSLVNKPEEVYDYIVENDLDVLAITETWLKDGNNNCVECTAAHPDGYTLLHKPRLDRRGGGVGIIFRDTITVKTECPFKAQSFESSEYKLHIKSVYVRIVIIYRPPPSVKNKCTSALFFKELTSYLEILTVSSGKLIVLGDFNFHMESDTDKDAVSFKELLNTTGLVQHVREVTHENGHMLDLVITRADDSIIKSTMVGVLFSDHHTISCVLNVGKPPLPKKQICFRSYKKIDIPKFKEDLLKMPILTNPEPTLDNLLEQYNSNISAVVDTHAPSQTKTVSIRPYTPWYNDNIHQEKKKRRKAEKRWHDSKLEIHKQIYCFHKNRTNFLIKTAKMESYNAKITDCGHDQKALFKVVNQLLGKKTDLTLPSEDNLADTLEKFSKFFDSKIINIRKNLDEAKNANHNKNTVLPLPISQPPPSLEFFHQLSIDEITKLVKASATKSCSLDPLPTHLLKDCLVELAPAIANVVNLSLAESTFPQEMKQALVTPLIKKPTLNREVLSNYRPVSNLSFVSKLTEKAVAKQLTDHMTTNKLHVPVQSAYRPNHSTETALLKVLNDILVSVDKGDGVILILLDLSAAFDTIDHSTLIDRLGEQIGVKGPALNWFKSYLSKRLQTIHVNGTSSSSTLVLFGVPQGSVLGPIKFSVYQSPLFDIARLHGVEVHLYADDTQLYVSYDLKSPEQLSTAVSKIEECIVDIRLWMSQNKLKLNDDKTELMYFSSRFKKQKVTPHNINIGDHNISPSSKAKNLGVIFDSHLTMEHHISSICRASYLHLRNIGKISKYLSTESLLKVIHAFISSRLDCNNSLLFGLPATQLKRLQTIQNTAARIVTKTRKREHITSELEKLHWLPIKYRIDHKILTLTYKCLTNEAPQYLRDLLEVNQPSRNLRSASATCLIIPDSGTKSYKDRSFSTAAPILWNSLPANIRNLSTLTSFKTAIKTYLFEQFLQSLQKDL